MQTTPKYNITFICTRGKSGCNQDKCVRVCARVRALVIHVQCHQPLRHNCGHFTLIFKFVAATILLQYWRQITIAQQ